jgi:hypothetical protein
MDNKKENVKDGKGRPSFTPTDEQRRMVESMTGLGVPDYEVAKVMSISLPTLRKYFHEQLEVGHIKSNFQVAQTLYKVATDIDHPRHVTAAIFWLKARAGWREAQVDEVGKKQIQADNARVSHNGTEWENLLTVDAEVIQ